jgi:hypothetical protein
MVYITLVLFIPQDDAGIILLNESESVPFTAFRIWTPYNGSEAVGGP